MAAWAKRERLLVHVLSRWDSRLRAGDVSVSVLSLVSLVSGVYLMLACT